METESCRSLVDSELISCEVMVQTLGQTSLTKRNMEKYFLGDFLSRFLAETLRKRKVAVKSFSKKFIVQSQL